MPSRSSLTHATLARWRLRHQMLTGSPCGDPVEVMRRLGAVQAQDYPGATWALWLRLIPGTTRAEIEGAFDRGEILRTHVLRPTWHFVTPADIRWMLRLTGPRILASSRSVHVRHGLDARTLSRAMGALQRALEGGQYLDREGVRLALKRARVPCPDVQRFSHLMMIAECDVLVCSGPKIGTKLTYALLDERAPAGAPRPSREDSVRELARRYYLTHGPATANDFAVWSGLTLTDARTALAEQGDLFTSAQLDGKQWWFPHELPTPARGVVARLIPNYDEYYIGFKHRAPLLARLRTAGVSLTLQQLLGNLIVVDGQIVGNWRRGTAAKATTLNLAPAVALTTRERAAVAREVPRLEAFLGVALTVRWTG
ncbi:MAG: winged helix DNA-binding domain-containing protein [Gemmatimonadota bacterium]